LRYKTDFFNFTLKLSSNLACVVEKLKQFTVTTPRKRLKAQCMIVYYI